MMLKPITIKEMYDAHYDANPESPFLSSASTLSRLPFMAEYIESPMFNAVDRIMARERGIFHPVYNSAEIGSDDPLEVLKEFQRDVYAMLTMKSDNYQHLFDLKNIEYAPIENYSMIETMTEEVEDETNIDFTHGTQTSTDVIGSVVDTLVKGAEESTVVYGEVNETENIGATSATDTIGAREDSSSNSTLSTTSTNSTETSSSSSTVGEQTNAHSEEERINSKKLDGDSTTTLGAVDETETIGAVSEKDTIGDRLDHNELEHGQRIDKTNETIGKRLDHNEVKHGQRLDKTNETIGARLDTTDDSVAGYNDSAMVKSTTQAFDQGIQTNDTTVTKGEQKDITDFTQGIQTNDTTTTQGIQTDITDFTQGEQENIHSEDERINKKLTASRIDTTVTDDTETETLGAVSNTDVIGGREDRSSGSVGEICTVEVDEKLSSTTNIGAQSNTREELAKENSRTIDPRTDTTNIAGYQDVNTIDSRTDTSEISKGPDKSVNMSDRLRKYELSRTGNIGVTTSQQMAESEIQLWTSFEFYNIIISDIIKSLCRFYDSGYEPMLTPMFNQLLRM